ncbi:MAG TPA: helix-turn-helix domain-containing GNAT family N-acetyltransferase [Burkholderiales bacterium]|nr:helix-turn-helix domain-containing GNAT family N-acetyltransferase [Burkholderiales bacterium]
MEAVRRFNRFYTRRIGVLQDRSLYRPYSLAEARVLYELGHRDAPTAGALAQELGIDTGYLSRILKAFARRGLVSAGRAPSDARRRPLSLTPAGKKACAALEARSRKEVGAMLEEVPASARTQLASAMAEVERLIEKEAPGVSLRPHRPGDMGWVVHRHGVLYFREYGWDERFEALVAGIAKDFIEKLDSERERCWIAEMGGRPVGSVFVVQQSKTVAKLRLLLVEPEARGQGLGRRLVDECIAFARAKGYRRLVLWTQSCLAAARAIYKAAGFRRTRTERHGSFGYHLTGEYWELEL